jgi:DNA topoisomerase IA
MAEHIKKIQERQYVTKTSDRFLVPTNLGIALVDGML